MTSPSQTQAETAGADSDSAQARAGLAVQQRRRPAAAWSKTTLNFWLDCFLLVAFLSLVWVTAVLRFLFPAGAAADEWSLWGWKVEQWRDVQFVVLCVLSLAVLLHVMLHWSWVCGVAARHLRSRSAVRNDGSQTLAGVAVLLIVLHVLAFGLLAAWYCLEHRVL
jgi:hypothetical protein